MLGRSGWRHAEELLDDEFDVSRFSCKRDGEVLKGREEQGGGRSERQLVLRKTHPLQLRRHHHAEQAHFCARLSVLAVRRVVRQLQPSFNVSRDYIYLVVEVGGTALPENKAEVHEPRLVIQHPVPADKFSV